jgi:HEAT repeat protein
MTGTPGLEKEEIKDLDQIQIMLKSNSSEERFQAIHFLMRNNFHETSDILQNIVLHDTQVSIRELALIFLVLLNPHNLMFTLKKLYNNPNEKKEIRARVVWALSQIKTEEAFEFLKITLTDKTEEVLYWAIAGLPFFENPTEVLPIIRSLLANSRQSLVRQTAAWTLGICGDRDAKDILEKQLLQDTHPAVRLLCASALTKLNDLSSISILNKSLQKDANELPRREAAHAIGNILDFQKISTQNIDPLLLRDTRAHAVRSLSKALLRDQSYIVRRSCAESLAKINDKSAVKNLINAMSMDTNQFVRCEIARTLGSLGDASAIETLKKAARSQYRRIVEAANKALEQLQ